MGGVLVTASGVAFAASEQVKVFWEQPATALVTATTARQGGFTGSGALPFHVPVGALRGAHVVRAVGQSSHAVAYALFIVLAPTPTTTATSTGTSTPTQTPTTTPTPINTATSTSTATLLVNPSYGTVGQTVTFTGTGLGPSETVVIRGDDSAATVLYGATTAASSVFTLRGPVHPAPYGRHILTATGQTCGKTARTTFFELPVLALRPGTGSVGATIGVGGYGYAAGESVVLHWGSVMGPVVATTASNSGGSASTFFTVPTGATAGKHPLYGVGQSSHAVGQGVLTVQ